MLKFFVLFSWCVCILGGGFLILLLIQAIRKRGQAQQGSRYRITMRNLLVVCAVLICAAVLTAFYWPNPAIPPKEKDQIESVVISAVQAADGTDAGKIERDALTIRDPEKLRRLLERIEGLPCTRSVAGAYGQVESDPVYEIYLETGEAVGRNRVMTVYPDRTEIKKENGIAIYRVTEKSDALYQEIRELYSQTIRDEPEAELVLKPVEEKEPEEVKTIGESQSSPK